MPCAFIRSIADGLNPVRPYRGHSVDTIVNGSSAQVSGSPTCGETELTRDGAPGRATGMQLTGPGINGRRQARVDGDMWGEQW